MSNNGIFVLSRSRVIACDAEVLEGDKYEAVICNTDPRHNTTRRVRSPLTIDADESDSAQCLWTPMSDCLLSSALVEELRSAEITGFTSEEVRITGTSETRDTYERIRADRKSV